MFCMRCGAANPNDGRFCVKCGAPVSGQASAPASVAPHASAPQPSAVPSAASGPQLLPFIAPPQGIGSVESSGKALGSLISGILFFFFPAAIVAVVLGHLALSEINKSAGRLAGRGMAVAGLVLGYIGILSIPFILIVAAIAIPNLLRARIAANEASAVESLVTVNRANIEYFSTYGNGYAPALATLGGETGELRSCHVD